MKVKKKSPPRRRSARPPGDGPVVVVEPPGEAKMSEVLWEFVEPYLGTPRDEQDLRKLLDLAVLAWCIPLLPPDQRGGLVREVLNSVPADARPSLAELLAEMVQRKEALFAHNQRMILSYTLTPTPDGPHLLVASTLPGS